MRRTMLVIALCALASGQHLVGSEASTDGTTYITADGIWTTYTTADGMPYDPVGAIAFAPDGTLWCVHVVFPGGGGISHFDGATWTLYTTEDGLASNYFWWFEPLTVTPDGVVWVGTFDGGVSRFDGETWTTFTIVDGLLSDVVPAVALAPNGDLWSAHVVPTSCPGCRGGISRFDGETWTAYPGTEIFLPIEFALCIAVSPDGTLWVGGDGVSRFDGEIWTHYTHYTTGLEVVPAMALAPDGTLWVGGDGVSRFDGETWTHYSLEEMGAVDWGGDCYGVASLAVGPDDALWAGTDCSGVSSFDGESWVNYTEDDGLVDNGVISIAVAPDGALWFGTGEGISRYLPGPTPW